MRFFLSILLTVLFQGCTSVVPPVPPDVYIAPRFVPPAQGSLIVLLPSTSKAPEFAPGEPLVTQQIYRHLTAGGYRVVALDAANHALIWSQEIAAVGGIYDPTTGALRAAAYEQALGALVRRVARETNCSFVLSPSLVLRDARLSGISAYWDGQSRTLPTARTYGSNYRFDGTTTALSVELIAIAADGKIGFRTFGGTSLPYRADAFSAKFEPRPELFSSQDETADGVRIALAPLLTR